MYKIITKSHVSDQEAEEIKAFCDQSNAKTPADALCQLKAKFPHIIWGLEQITAIDGKSITIKVFP